MDRTTSPLGDRRERPVLCSWCLHRQTMNISGRCDRCYEDEADRADALDAYRTGHLGGAA